jgi:hypothetical protein
MGLTDVPSELFRMKNIKMLWLEHNNLCALPSEIAHLTTLEGLYVRRFEAMGSASLTNSRFSTISSRLFRPSSVW